MESSVELQKNLHPNLSSQGGGPDKLPSPYLESPFCEKGHLHIGSLSNSEVSPSWALEPDKHVSGSQLSTLGGHVDFASSLSLI